MRKKVLNILMLIVAFSSFSCQGRTGSKVPEVKNDSIATQEEIIEDHFVNAITINSANDTLIRIYNTARGNVSLMYKGDTVTLQQDTMASGIRYSNSEYIMTEWHGTTTLEKNGEVIFQNPVEK